MNGPLCKDEPDPRDHKLENVDPVLTSIGGKPNATYIYACKYCGKRFTYWLTMPEPKEVIDLFGQAVKDPKKTVVFFWGIKEADK